MSAWPSFMLPYRVCQAIDLAARKSFAPQHYAMATGLPWEAAREELRRLAADGKLIALKNGMFRAPEKK